jgi:hypothetical protein
MFVLQNNEDSAVYVMRERKAIAWAESVNRSLALDWRVKNAKVRSQVAVMTRSIFFLEVRVDFFLVVNGRIRCGQGARLYTVRIMLRALGGCIRNHLKLA